MATTTTIRGKNRLPTSNYTSFGMTLEPMVLDAVDQIRGDISRSLYIRRAIIEKMKNDGHSDILEKILPPAIHGRKRSSSSGGGKK